MAFALGRRLASRMLSSIRWTEQQPKSGGSNPRGDVDPADPFGRVLLTEDLVAGGEATGLLMTGSKTEGWNASESDDVTVYEDEMLDTGETILSGTEIHVKFMHGEWIFDDVKCSEIQEPDE